MGNFDFINNEKLKKQIEFAVTVDEMKNILRRNLVANGSRRENDAEHSWHLAMLAMLFEEYSSEKVDMGRVLKIALVHDLVEVYAGDTFCYDKKGNEDKLERETKAALHLPEYVHFSNFDELFESIFNEAKKLLMSNGLIILEYNTSYLTPYQIATHVLRTMEDLNNENRNR